MLKRTAPRSVVCYHCRRPFQVGGKTSSTNCPQCNKRVIVEDVVVKQLTPVKQIQTCGRLVIHKKGRVIAQHVTANLGIEVRGALEASVVSDGHVIIGAGARWKGDCAAGSLSIEPGALIEGGVFEVPREGAAPLPLPEAGPSRGAELPASVMRPAHVGAAPARASQDAEPAAAPTRSDAAAPGAPERERPGPKTTSTGGAPGRKASPSKAPARGAASGKGSGTKSSAAESTATRPATKAKAARKKATAKKAAARTSGKAASEKATSKKATGKKAARKKAATGTSAGSKATSAKATRKKAARKKASTGKSASGSKPSPRRRPDGDGQQEQASS